MTIVWFFSDCRIGGYLNKRRLYSYLVHCALLKLNAIVVSQSVPESKTNNIMFPLGLERFSVFDIIGFEKK